MLDILGIDKVGEQIRKDRVEKYQTIILKHAKSGEPFYIDEVDFDSLTCGVQDDSPNIVGAAVRILLRKGAIHKTGAIRKSERKGSKGRTIFEYRLGGL